MLKSRKGLKRGRGWEEGLTGGRGTWLLTEDDEVLGDRGVDNVHAAHGAAGVVEHPVLVEVQVGRRHLALELLDDVGHDGAGVGAVRRDGPAGHLVQVLHVEDEEALEVLLDVVDARGEHGGEEGQDAEQGGHPALSATAAAASVGLCLAF